MRFLTIRSFQFSLLTLLLASTFGLGKLQAAPFSDRGFGWGPGTSYGDTNNPYNRDAGYNNFDGYNSYRSPYYYNPSYYNDSRYNRNYYPVNPYNDTSNTEQGNDSNYSW